MVTAFKSCFLFIVLAADRLYASFEETCTYNIWLFRDWVKTIPGFSKLITKFESNLDALANFIDMVSAYMWCLSLYKTHFWMSRWSLQQLVGILTTLEASSTMDWCIYLRTLIPTRWTLQCPRLETPAKPTMGGTTGWLHAIYALPVILMNSIVILSKLSSILMLVFTFFNRAYMDMVASGQKKLCATKFPSFLYNMDLFDSSNKHAGFLWGYVLLRVC